jgi:hypothetical protein
LRCWSSAAERVFVTKTIIKRSGQAKRCFGCKKNSDYPDIVQLKVQSFFTKCQAYHASPFEGGRGMSGAKDFNFPFK